MVPVGAWNVENFRGNASAFHAVDPPAARTLWDVRVTAPALVLGSMQEESAVKMSVAADGGIETPRRRSGGGAVWVGPVGTIWFDIVIPRGDALWDDDVARSMLWLGRVLADVIGDGARVFDGRYRATDLARAYCFGGTAPGEVIGPRGKIVGISQRRTRDLARFQCVAYSEYDPPAVARLFADPSLAAQVATTGVQTVSVAPPQFVASLLERLPS